MNRDKNGKGNKNIRSNSDTDKTDQNKQKRKILIAILLAIIIIILGLFVVIHHAPPEGTSRGTLVKVVLDQDNNPVQGAVVKLSNESCGNTIIATETTNNQGKAYFYNLKYETYYINVTYTVNGKTYYADGNAWETVIIDDSLIEVKNFLRGYPENVLPRGR